MSGYNERSLFHPEYGEVYGDGYYWYGYRDEINEALGDHREHLKHNPEDAEDDPVPFKMVGGKRKNPLFVNIVLISNQDGKGDVT